MKHIIYFILLAQFLACQNDTQDGITSDLVHNSNTVSADGTPVKPEDLPVIKFEEEAYLFGDITQGEKVYHRFKFKNTGKSNLIISSANASCGCTVPSYPKKPIEPGQEDVIEVVFNSEGKEGQQTKQVTVVANTQPATTVIALKGNVIAPKTQEK